MALEPAEALGHRIAALAAHLHAVTYELLVLLREFDERTGWNGGFASCAHWIHWQTGIALGAAREKVRVAHALASLPRISATMARGAISYAKVRALTRVATPETEAALLDFAQAGTAAHVERLVGAWRRLDHVATARAEARHLHRTLSTWVDDDGMVVIRGRLTPEVGAVVQRALEAASDRLFRESKDTAKAGGIADEVTAGQRRVDALGRLAEVALAADMDAGTAGDRYQVVVHLEAASPVAAGEGLSGALEMDHGAVDVSAETSRRLACDASIVSMRHGHGVEVLDIGRKTRTVPPSIRRALQARDRSCRFPGCTARRCDAHHVEHWVDGGATSLENLVLLCRRHHRLVHEGGVELVQERNGCVTFRRPDGAVIEAAPPLPVATRVVEPAARAEELPVWDGARFDVAYAIDVLYQPPRSSRAAGAPPDARRSADGRCRTLADQHYQRSGPRSDDPGAPEQ